MQCLLTKGGYCHGGGATSRDLTTKLETLAAGRMQKEYRRLRNKIRINIVIVSELQTPVLRGIVGLKHMLKERFAK